MGLHGWGVIFLLSSRMFNYSMACSWVRCPSDKFDKYSEIVLAQGYPLLDGPRFMEEEQLRELSAYYEVPTFAIKTDHRANAVPAAQRAWHQILAISDSNHFHCKLWELPYDSCTTGYLQLRLRRYSSCYNTIIWLGSSSQDLYVPHRSFDCCRLRWTSGTSQCTDWIYLSW